MKSITFTTDLRNKIEMNEGEFETTVKETIDFAVNEKGYGIADLTVEMIAEDISGIIKSYHNMEHEMNRAGLVIIENVLNEMQSVEKSSSIG